MAAAQEETRAATRRGLANGIEADNAGIKRRRLLEECLCGIF